MSEKKYLDYEGLSQVADQIKSRLKTVTTMPLSATDKTVVQYLGETDNTFTKGHIYQFNASKTLTIGFTSASGYNIGKFFGFDELPVTEEGWTVSTISDKDLLNEMINELAEFTVISGESSDINCVIQMTDDPMVIGALYPAMIFGYAQGATPSVESYEYTLQFGSDSWVDITEDGSTIAYKLFNQLQSEKQDKCVYIGSDSRPNPGVDFANKLAIEDGNNNTLNFSICEPQGEQVHITTANELQNYVNRNGTTISIVQQPFASQTPALLIQGYEYFYNNFFSAFNRIRTDEFLTSIDTMTQGIEAVTNAMVEELDLWVYPSYEWIDYAPSTPVDNSVIDILIANYGTNHEVEIVEGNYVPGDFTYQFGYIDRSSYGYMEYLFWDGSQWWTVAYIYNDPSNNHYYKLQVKDALGIVTVNGLEDSVAREMSAAALADAALAYNAAKGSIKSVESIPLHPEDKDIFLYTGDPLGMFKTGRIYQFHYVDPSEAGTTWYCYRDNSEAPHYYYNYFPVEIPSVGDHPYYSKDTGEIKVTDPEDLQQSEQTVVSVGDGYVTIQEYTYTRAPEDDIGGTSYWTDITQEMLEPVLNTVNNSIKTVEDNAAKQFQFGGLPAPTYDLVGRTIQVVGSSSSSASTDGTFYKFIGENGAVIETLNDLKTYIQTYGKQFTFVDEYRPQQWVDYHGKYIMIDNMQLTYAYEGGAGQSYWNKVYAFATLTPITHFAKQQYAVPAGGVLVADDTAAANLNVTGYSTITSVQVGPKGIPSADINALFDD